MKNTHQHQTSCRFLLAGLLGLASAISSYAQFTFDCGSNGTNGALNITTNTTLDLPPDGIFNFTTITIAPNATLKFNPNALNTPVYLLAQGNVTINGTIDVSGAAANGIQGGAGGPGGFAGGSPANGGLDAGDGYGPGAGRTGTWGGAAVYGGVPAHLLPSAGTNNGTVYGSALLIPLVGGSGGSGCGPRGGTGGGGAILIASNTRIDVQGSITTSVPTMNYGDYFNGLGSGGAIRLVAPTVSGTGQLSVTGAGNNRATDGSGYPSGGAGRIRIDTLGRRTLTLTCNPVSVTTIGSNMIAIPTNAPRLDITQVASNSIAAGTRSPVFFMLPKGADTNQTVTVQASNFGCTVPVRVVLTPDCGPSSSYDTSIDNTTIPASATVPVVVPVNVRVQVSAWTR